MLNEILENRTINQIATQFAPSPARINQTHEADAELIAFGEQSEFYLAFTIDTISEEIQAGLYRDPFQIGWMLAMVNFSDLAAVGAQPLGLLAAINLQEKARASFVQALTRGIAEACEILGTHVLGGDTNFGKTDSLTGCAVGIVSKSKALTRVGCQPGDIVYLSAPAGLGNAFAYQQFSQKSFGINYKPLARLRQGQLLGHFASACMDTSDGVIHTLDQLMRLNTCELRIPGKWKTILHPAALQLCQSSGIPPWLMLAGFHGEFELCFTIPQKIESQFLKAVKKINWTPIRIGEVQSGFGIVLTANGSEVTIDSAYIRNLSGVAARDPEEYMHRMLQYANKLKI